MPTGGRRKCITSSELDGFGRKSSRSRASLGSDAEMSSQSSFDSDFNDNSDGSKESAEEDGVEVVWLSPRIPTMATPQSRIGAIFCVENRDVEEEIMPLYDENEPVKKLESPFRADAHFKTPKSSSPTLKKPKRKLQPQEDERNVQYGKVFDWKKFGF